MPLRKDAKIERMRQVPLFAGCSKAELGRIAGIADEVAFPTGRVLVREGERGREFCVLVEGAADVRRRGRKVADLLAGDFFGEIALLTDMPRNATVATTSPARVLVVTDRDFRRLCRELPSIQAKVLRALAERLAPAAV